MKTLFAYRPDTGDIVICPKETQFAIYNRYKEVYGLTEEQMWDYGMCDWEDLDEGDLESKPSEDILSIIGDDMQLIWAFINDETWDVDFENINGMDCGCEVAELMERLGFQFTDDSETGLRCTYTKDEH